MLSLLVGWETYAESGENEPWRWEYIPWWWVEFTVWKKGHPVEAAKYERKCAALLGQGGKDLYRWDDQLFLLVGEVGSQAFRQALLTQLTFNGQTDPNTRHG